MKSIIRVKLNCGIFNSGRIGSGWKLASCLGPEECGSGKIKNATTNTIASRPPMKKNGKEYPPISKSNPPKTGLQIKIIN